MQGDIDRVLIDAATIERRVAEIAVRISEDLAALSGESPPQLTLVPILTGSIIFVSDLIRKLPLRMQIRLISVQSYAGTSTISHGTRIRRDLTSLPDSFEGIHVLVLDDILDSGKTLRVVTDLITRRGPASVRVCVLLRKRRPEALKIHVDYVCFEVPNEFVVGYGLDFNNSYRNLPDIVTLRPEVMKGEG